MTDARRPHERVAIDAPNNRAVLVQPIGETALPAVGQNSKRALRSPENGLTICTAGDLTEVVDRVRIAESAAKRAQVAQSRTPIDKRVGPSWGVSVADDLAVIVNRGGLAPVASGKRAQIATGP